MAGTDRDELWEVQCQCIYCRDKTVCTISLSLAKPGEAMPGPYISLMVLRRRASRSGPGRVAQGKKITENGAGQRRHRSDSTFNFKQRQSHAPHCGACDCQERIRLFGIRNLHRL